MTEIGHRLDTHPGAYEPVIRLHDPRHGACSLLFAGGVPIEIVQMILGHSSPEVTRRVYSHVMRKATAEQVETATELLARHRRTAKAKSVDGDEDEGTTGVLVPA